MQAEQVVEDEHVKQLSGHGEQTLIGELSG